MAGKTTYLKNALFNYMFQNTAFASPYASLYMGLYLDSSLPTVSGGGSELVAGTSINYARAPVTFSVSTTGAVANSGLILFNQALSNWGTIGGFAIFNALTVGNMLYFGTLAANKIIGNTDILEFTTGSLILTET